MKRAVASLHQRFHNNGDHHKQKQQSSGGESNTVVVKTTTTSPPSTRSEQSEFSSTRGVPRPPVPGSELGAAVFLSNGETSKTGFCENKTGFLKSEEEIHRRRNGAGGMGQGDFDLEANNYFYYQLSEY